MRVKTLGMYSEGGGLPHLHTPISSTGVLQVRFFRKYGCEQKLYHTTEYIPCGCGSPMHGVEVECWLCNPRVSGSIPGAGNLEKLFIWIKIYGLTQKQTVTDL